MDKKQVSPGILLEEQCWAEFQLAAYSVSFKESKYGRMIASGPCKIFAT